jgi:hypothetical protein
MSQVCYDLVELGTSAVLLEFINALLRLTRDTSGNLLSRM